MSDQLEGAGARIARQQRDALKKILDKADDTHELIVVMTDLSGGEPTQVHIQGPSKDRVLLYGMLEVAKDVVRMSNSVKIETPDPS